VETHDETGKLVQFGLTTRWLGWFLEGGVRYGSRSALDLRDMILMILTRSGKRGDVPLKFWG